MWYVVQVRSGTEHNIRIQCNKKIPNTIMERCFIPYYEEKKKQNGSWNTLQKILFPGYIFMITEDVEKLFFHLKTIEGMTKLIGAGNDIIPLTEEEIIFLQRLGGDEQIVSMSEGIIEGTQVIITSGPLMGMEGLIQKNRPPQTKGMARSGTLWKDAAGGSGTGDNEESVVYCFRMEEIMMRKTRMDHFSRGNMAIEK